MLAPVPALPTPAQPQPLDQRTLALTFSLRKWSNRTHIWSSITVVSPLLVLTIITVTEISSLTVEAVVSMTGLSAPPCPIAVLKQAPCE